MLAITVSAASFGFFLTEWNNFNSAVLFKRNLNISGVKLEHLKKYIYIKSRKMVKKIPSDRPPVVIFPNHIYYNNMEIQLVVSTGGRGFFQLL